ncbi:hypothetical protein BC332_18809 [Capsicum chinense]|nr:hypothetical protein BC332_18809 [Capsicum chinense]
MANSATKHFQVNKDRVVNSFTAWRGTWLKSGFDRGAIIGVLDTRVWPESPSFIDHGMPTLPKYQTLILQVAIASLVVKGSSI